MKIKDIYVVDLFVPTEICCSMLIGTSELRIFKKVDVNTYVDLYTKRIYNFPNCNEKIVNAVPLSEYFYKIGLKKHNEYQNKEDVYRLVKDIKIIKHFN